MKRPRSRGLRRTVLAVMFPALLLVSTAYPPAFAQDVTPAAHPTDLTGVAPQSLTGERRAEFEAYVANALLHFGVPGASVAVVQGGDVVYLKGFGVTELGSTQAVDPDTMFMIGSVTKSMTTMLAATLVDDGRLTWDTRLVDLIPAFAVGDPKLTQSLTVRDAFCNCTGIPGRDVELFFEGGALTPEGVVTALADVPLTNASTEVFQYNNLLIAAGGYALGAAAGGGVSDLGRAYDAALREQVLGPIGMVHSTFDAAAALASGNYALPHATDLSGGLRPLPLVAERSFLPVAPAAGLWSNAREMARYVQTELTGGVAPGGTRVVTEESLAATWAPGVAVPPLPTSSPSLAASQSGYGLGWMSGEYSGLRVINHSGGTYGFGSELAFLPEADLGIVILSNARTPAGAFPYAVQFRLLELLFEQDPEIDAHYVALLATMSTASAVQLGRIDPTAVAPYLGRYAHPRLGEVTVSLRGDRLVLDLGELGSELRPRATDAAGATAYLLHDPPLSLYSEAGATVNFAGGGAAPRLTFTIPANPTGPEQAYVFEPLAPDGTPIP